MGGFSLCGSNRNEREDPLSARTGPERFSIDTQGRVRPGGLIEGSGRVARENWAAGVAGKQGESCFEAVRSIDVDDAPSVRTVDSPFLFCSIFLNSRGET